MSKLNSRLTLMRRAAQRGPVISGPPPAIDIETYREDDNHSLHLIAETKLARRLLTHRDVGPFSQPDAIAALSDRFAIESHWLQSFFQFSPIFLHGPAHRLARRRFTQHIRRMHRTLAPDIAGFAEDCLRSVDPSPTDDLANALVIPFVDNVFSQVFELTLPGSSAQYARLAGHPQSIFEVVHHPKKLKQTTRQLNEFLDCHSADAAALESAMLLVGYVFMGRDPLVGALTDFLRHLQALPEQERRDELAVIDSHEIFDRTSPVNFITRVALTDISILGENFRRGDLLALLLKDCCGNSTNAESLAFAAGPHTCAGRALSLAIADGFLAALKARESQIPWQEIDSGSCEPSVFRRYRRTN